MLETSFSSASFEVSTALILRILVFQGVKLRSRVSRPDVLEEYGALFTFNGSQLLELLNP
jgi:hypothetical protein